ncbi:hypothetical protein ACHAQE_002413 [Botrytis cinerea]
MSPPELLDRRPGAVRHGAVFAQQGVDGDGDAGLGGEGEKGGLESAAEGGAEDADGFETGELGKQGVALGFAEGGEEWVGEGSGVRGVEVVVGLEGEELGDGCWDGRGNDIPRHDERNVRLFFHAWDSIWISLSVSLSASLAM